MITAIVEFTLPAPMTPAQAKETFLSTAPKYRGMAGLIRKYYWLSDDGKKAGGIYLWQSREAANQVYTDEWKAFVTGKYGSPPSLTFLASPVVVDNLSDEVIAD
ncbi:MAG: YdhR family protein [Burkholderiaceae bacterium]